MQSLLWKGSKFRRQIKFEEIIFLIIRQPGEYCFFSIGMHRQCTFTLSGIDRRPHIFSRQPFSIETFPGNIEISVAHPLISIPHKIHGITIKRNERTTFAISGIDTWSGIDWFRPAIYRYLVHVPYIASTKSPIPATAEKDSAAIHSKTRLSIPCPGVETRSHIDRFCPRSVFADGYIEITTSLSVF